MIFHDHNWWVLFAAPFIYLLKNTTHELSHGLCVLPWGWGFTLKPYPTKFDGKWYFAICLFHTKDGCEHIPQWGWAMNFISPRFMNTLQMTAVLVLAHTIPNPSAQTVFMMIGAAQIIDGFVGIWPAIYRFEEKTLTDIYRFWKNSGWNKNFVRAINISWFLVLVGVFFI